MFADHFDGKSIRRRTLDWLGAAERDAAEKEAGCVVVSSEGN